MSETVSAFSQPGVKGFVLGREGLLAPLEFITLRNSERLQGSSSWNKGRWGGKGAVDENVKWSKHCGKQYSDLSKN